MGKITIKNDDAAVDILIEKSPFNLFSRELTQNSIEASIDYILNSKIDTPIFIDIWKDDFEVFDPEGSRAPKLMWGNFGGLSSTELHDAIQLFSSVRKEQSKNKNYGVGMIMSTLGFTDIAILSKKDNKIHLVICEKNPVTGKYGTVDHFDEEGNLLGDVVDVTYTAMENAKKFKMDHDYDYTTLILLGRGKDKKKQDTFKTPFPETMDLYDRKRSGKWLVDELMTRFWSIPKNVIVRLGEGVHDNGPSGNIHLKLLPELHRSWEKKSQQQQPEDCSQGETVTGPGVKVHFEYNAVNEKSKKSDTFLQGDRALTRPVCGIVFRNELFDIRNTSTGMIDFLRGIGVGGQHKSFSVYVEVTAPDWDMTLDRSAIYYEKDPRKKQATLDDFTPIVTALQPKWWITKAEQKRNLTLETTNKGKLEKKADFYEKQKKIGKGGFLGDDEYFAIDPKKLGVHDTQELEGVMDKDKKTKKKPKNGGNPNITPPVPPFETKTKETKKFIVGKRTKTGGTTALSGKIVRRVTTPEVPKIRLCETEQQAKDLNLIDKDNKWLAEYDRAGNELIMNPYADVIETQCKVFIRKHGYKLKDRDTIATTVTDWIAHNKLVDPILHGKNALPGVDVAKTLDKTTLSIIGGALHGCDSLVKKAIDDAISGTRNNSKINEEVIVNGEDARDTESEPKLTPEEEIKYQANGVVFPTEQ